MESCVISIAPDLPAPEHSVLFLGTPLEVSKRWLMTPLLKLQLTLWILQLGIASEISLISPFSVSTF